MDIDYLKLITSSKLDESRLINGGDFIELDIMNFLSSLKIDDMKKCFAPSNDIKYGAQIKCNTCGRTFENNSLSKTNLFEILKHKRNHTSDCIYLECPDCKSKRERKEREWIKNRDLQENEKIIENTKNYIANYLDPEHFWKEGVSTYTKWEEISNTRKINSQAIQSYISNMDYIDFLKTPYWKAISEYKRKRANYCCELCCSKGKLNVHHKTYERHGSEHKFSVMDKDLICLCSDCHAKFHDKVVD